MTLAGVLAAVVPLAGEGAGLDAAMGGAMSVSAAALPGGAEPVPGSTARRTWPSTLGAPPTSAPSSADACAGLPAVGSDDACAAGDDADDRAGFFDRLFVRRMPPGFGDQTTVVGGDLLVLDALDAGIGLSTRVRGFLPGDARALAGAETDHSLQIDADQGLGPVTLFASAGRRYLRDAFDPERRHTWFGFAGASHGFASGLQVGAVLDCAQAVYAGDHPLREASLYASRTIGANARLRAFVFATVREPVPLRGAGLSVVIGF